MHRALQLEDILEHLFNFLTIDEIKVCRLVNTTWKFVGNKGLRRGSTIFFDFKYYNPEEMSILREKMISISNSYILADKRPECTPFASFFFRGVISLPLFATFMRKLGDCVRDVTIDGVLKDPNDPTRKFVDISPFLGESLERLSIDRGYSSFKYHMSANCLRSIKHLSLGNCAIIVDDIETRISPICLYLLKTSYFIKNGEKLTDFVLNELFDFRRAKVIVLEPESVILDFAMCADNKTPKHFVIFQNSKIRNWDKCNWKVDELQLEQTPFGQENSLEVHDISFDETTVHFSSFHNPEILTSLSLFGGATVEWKRPLHFPSLKSLLLENECLNLLPNFSQNGHLVDLQLISTLDYDEIHVSVKDLPVKVEVLQLESIKILPGEPSFAVAQLNLVNYFSLDDFLQILLLFTPESVFIRDDCMLDNSMDDILTFLRHPKPCEDYFLGEFNWTRKKIFKNSPFSRFVNAEAEFYFFKGPHGVACDRNTFEKYVLN